MKCHGEPENYKLIYDYGKKCSQFMGNIYLLYEKKNGKDQFTP
jgi:hypothetical protein